MTDPFRGSDRLADLFRRNAEAISRLEGQFREPPAEAEELGATDHEEWAEREAHDPDK